MADQSAGPRREPPAGETPPPRHPVVTWLRRLGPAAVSAGILYYYFRGENWEEIGAAFRQADLWLMLPARIIPLLVFWWFEALINQRLLLWFDKPVSLRDIFWTRGALYLLMLINVNVSNGGMFIYLLRKSRMGVAKLAGIQLFRAGISLWGLLVFFTATFAAAALYDRSLFGVFSLTAVFTVLGLGWLWLIQAWTYWRMGWRWWPFNYLLRRDHDLWLAFAQARGVHWLKLSAYLMPPMLVSLAGMYASAWAFQIRVPVVEFMIKLPLVMFVANLPVAFGQLGTTTVAWETFFGDYGSHQSFLAFSLAFPVVSMLLRAVIGLLSLRPALAEWSRLRSASASEIPSVPSQG